MGLFGRGRRTFGEGDHREVVALLQREFAEHGIETVPDDGALRAADGRTYGTAGIAHLASLNPRRRWGRLVAAHVAQLLVAEATPEARSLDEVRDTLYLRVVHVETLAGGDPGIESAARPLVGDLVVLPAIDHPEHVSLVDSAETVGLLGGWDAVREVGLANLRRLRPDQTTTIESQGATIHLSGGGFMNASRALVMDDLLREDFGVERPRGGVLVVLPNRQVVALHVLGGPELPQAVQALLGIASEESDQPGGVSEHVYLVRDGVWEQVTHHEPDGSTSVRVEGELERAMRDLGLLDD
ncbi:hypothetical protein [Cellulomonas carbonis]|uniref:Uncharacterized protein n=1 Tax=Cellulomonas carbonis T26 TaxID=947969 RepID=A0A0A0BLQ0_9CELL|nr:hypothetical protein [Cellulomonas carbonis]KGM08891.1 hypothetical protein N868_05850 [Cellulomonas carbonis T26]GGC01727.1 hypothetical protein GCM10010972_13210 [Cellulomonas carbonis]